MNRARRVAPVLFLTLFATAASGQMIQPPFDTLYAFADLGPPPGVPAQLGGLCMAPGQPNTLLIGGAANTAAGLIYAVPIVRDAMGRITGFALAPETTVFCVAAFNDGGVTFGPGGVLFLSRWPVNGLGQRLPGSSITDRIIDLAPLGIEQSHASINFPPAGFPGAGRVKLCSWANGQWSDAALSADGAGTFDLINVQERPGSRLPGGPEGFAYVPLTSAGFAMPTMIVSEFSAGNVVVYDLDPLGDPVVSSRRVFMSGLSGAEGAFIDPVTGDFVFSTFGGGNRVVVVRGFSAPPPPCNPDFNGDGTLNPDDLADYIVCYFTEPPCSQAEFNFDGSINPDDLSDYINAYFDGCE